MAKLETMRDTFAQKAVEKAKAEMEKVQARPSFKQQKVDVAKATETLFENSFWAEGIKSPTLKGAQETKQNLLNLAKTAQDAYREAGDKAGENRMKARESMLRVFSQGEARIRNSFDDVIHQTMALLGKFVIATAEGVAPGRV